MKKQSQARRWMILTMVAIMMLGVLRSPAVSSAHPALWKREGAYVYSFQQYTLTQWNTNFNAQWKRCLAFVAEVKTFSANEAHFFWINEEDEGFIYTFDTQELIPFGPYDTASFFWDNPVDMVLAHERL